MTNQLTTSRCQWGMGWGYMGVDSRCDHPAVEGKLYCKGHIEAMDRQHESSIIDDPADTAIGNRCSWTCQGSDETPGGALRCENQAWGDDTLCKRHRAQKGDELPALDT